MTVTLRNNLPLWILCILAIVTALHFAESLAAPLVLAFVTALMLGPVNTHVRRLGAGKTSAALMTLVFALAVLIVAVLLFRPWIADVVDAGPRIRFEMRRTLVELRQQLNGLFDIQREVISAIDPDGGAPEQGGADGVPTLSDAALMAPQAIGQILLFIGGLFFFLLGKEDLYAALSGRAEGGTAGAFEAAESRVARYFGTVAVINLAFGALVAVVLSLAGLPAAPLWGVIAALANFVVYLGPAIVAAALLLAGTVHFDGAMAFAPSALFIGLNTIEGQFVTPTLLGRQMRLSPLLVFVALAFWLWLWGPIGGIVAIPLLVWGAALLDAAGTVQPSVSDDGASISDTDTSRSSGSKEAGVKAS
ncbi:AI-2E family transporter [Phycobacter sp. K97]|uniref:AI-2E family transporter n=1 Tax=Phycobacter sedimenti TaxID=3133977 RepID=UPI00311F277D